VADTSAKPALELDAKSSSLTAKPTRLPSEGEFHPANKKKYRETVVMVPFYGAKKSSLKRHIDFVNELGYDCAVFRLKFRLNEFDGTLFSSQSELGVKHIWADQVEGLLNALPGNKIIYAFSNPCASAIEAVSRRHAADITGLVCDSGPASDLFKSMLSYYQYEEPIASFPLRLAKSIAMSLIWSPNFKAAVHADLANLPAGFKILSIRGWKDKIISAQDIDKVFDPFGAIDWQRLSLPQAGHLNGLRDFSEEYIPAVKDFLRSISTAV
jgi:hypothetical protein